MTIRIVTDSTCDLPKGVAAQYGITIVPCYINIGERSFLDGVDLSRQEFYERLPAYDPAPKTAAPGIETFRQTYEQLIEDGATEILSIHVSSTLSAVVSAAAVAARETTKVAVTVVDSRQLSLGTGFLALAAAKAAVSGCSVSEIIVRVNDQIARTHSYAILDTLEFLRRSGRVSRIVAGLGSLLQIKPVMKIYNGQVTAEKTRTRTGAIKRLMCLVKELGPLEQAAVLHAHVPERAEELRQHIRRVCPQVTLSFCEEITPVLGAHFGPGTVGLVCVVL